MAEQFVTGYLQALGFGTGLITLWIVYATVFKRGPKAEDHVEAHRVKGSLIPNDEEILS